MKTFEKNDNEFICRVCGKLVPELKYSSRDHCTKCLCSIHIDINPGDRANSCLGTLIPTDIETNNKKGYIIKYKCRFNNIFACCTLSISYFLIFV